MIEGRAPAASAGRASSWQMNRCPIAKPLIPVGATDQVRPLVLRSPAQLRRGPTRIAITDQVNRIAPNAITSPRFAFAIAGAGRHLAGAFQASSPNSVGRSFDRPFFYAERLNWPEQTSRHRNIVSLHPSIVFPETNINGRRHIPAQTAASEGQNPRILAEKQAAAGRGIQPLTCAIPKQRACLFLYESSE